MKAIDIYRDHYEEVCSWHDDEDEYNKYEWAASYIFDLTTYDGELDEKFVKDILEVCKVIADRSNYEYIANNDNYIKYILVCQLLDRFKWINWGTSIRGAWFENLNGNRKVILEEQPITRLNEKTGEWDHYKIDEVLFSYDNLKALIEFMEEEK